MRWLLPLLALPCLAQITVTVLPPTATQAVLVYTAPSASACTVAVSPAVGLSPLVHDVDPALFTGSNLDSRPGTASFLLQRWFVVGTRTSALSSDASAYSRALRAQTQYYFQVTCGASTGTGSFTTATPRLGNNYSDSLPFLSTSWGNYAWPDISFADQTKDYDDPLTGIRFKRFSKPGAFGYVGGVTGSKGGGALNLYVDINSAWTSASNITSGVSTSLASYSGASSDPIFITYDNNNLAPDGNQISGYFPGNFSLDNLQLNLFGNGSSATAADRTVQVCLVFYDSHTCNSPYFDVILPQTLVSTAVNYPASSVFPEHGPWQGWGIYPKRADFGVWVATISTSGHTVTASSNLFNTSWQAGAKYFIPGSSCTNSLCTIASVTNNQLMTVVESPGTLTNVTGYSAASGFLVKKKNGSGTVNVSAASFYAVSSQNLMPNESGTQMCNENQVTVSFAADGVTPITPTPGNLCMIGNATGYESLYLLIPATGETRMINPLFTDTSPQTGTGDEDLNGNKIQNQFGTSSASDANAFYALAQYNGGTYNGKHVFLKVAYTPGTQCVYQEYGVGAEHPPWYATGSHSPGQDPIAGPSGGPQAKDSLDGLSSCITYTITGLASAGKDLETQIYAQGNYKPVFGSVGGVGSMVGGKAQVPIGTTEGPNLLYDFDIDTAAIQLATDSFSTYPMRWVGVHNSDLQGTDRYVGISPSNGLGANSGYVPDPTVFRGPYTVVPTKVKKGGVFVTNTSLPADNSISEACPGGLASYLIANGAVGNNCIEFQSQMACNTNPYNGGGTGQTENAAFPCPYNAAFSMITPIGVGDFIRPVEGLVPSYCNPCEYLQIVQVTSLGSNNWQFIASRTAAASQGAGCSNGITTPEAWPNNWTLVTVAQCAVVFNLDTTNIAGGYLATWAGGGHASLGVGIAGAPTGVSGAIQGPGGVVQYQQPLTAQLLKGNSYSADAFFHGIEASTQIQSYPSNYQLAATGVGKTWFNDFHHLNPSSGTGPEQVVTIFPSTFQTGTLVGGTANVWQYGAPTGTVNFKTQPVVAYAGASAFQDISSAATGNSITDSTLYQFCVVYHANECRTGSTAGQAYLSAPFVGGAYPFALGQCVTDNVGFNFPCPIMLAANAAEIIQARGDVADPQAINWRRVGMGFMGPGRQYQFSSMIPEPTGKWGITGVNWGSGIRNDLMIAQLPGLPAGQKMTTPGNDYEPITVTLGGSTLYDQASIRFGYAENGATGNYYCMSRQEACRAGTNIQPFAYDVSDASTWNTCTTGCTITIPAIPGRVVYYIVDRRNSSTSATKSASPAVLAIP